MQQYSILIVYDIIKNPTAVGLECSRGYIPQLTDNASSVANRSHDLLKTRIDCSPPLALIQSRRLNHERRFSDFNFDVLKYEKDPNTQAFPNLLFESGFWPKMY